MQRKAEISLFKTVDLGILGWDSNGLCWITFGSCFHDRKGRC